MMKCACDYCIYHKDGHCSLEIIQINEIGMCEECITVSIPSAILQTLKEEQSKKLESQ